MRWKRRIKPKVPSHTPNLASLIFPKRCVVCKDMIWLEKMWSFYYIDNVKKETYDLSYGNICDRCVDQSWLEDWKEYNKKRKKFLFV